MANTHETLTGLFTDIADAIREKTGGTESIVADNFPAAIEGIDTGSKTVDITLTFTDGGWSDYIYKSGTTSISDVHYTSSVELTIGDMIAISGLTFIAYKENSKITFMNYGEDAINESVISGQTLTGKIMWSSTF